MAEPDSTDRAEREPAAVHLGSGVVVENRHVMVVPSGAVGAAPACRRELDDLDGVARFDPAAFERAPAV